MGQCVAMRRAQPCLVALGWAMRMGCMENPILTMLYGGIAEVARMQARVAITMQPVAYGLLGYGGYGAYTVGSSVGGEFYGGGYYATIGGSDGYGIVSQWSSVILIVMDISGSD